MLQLLIRDHKFKIVCLLLCWMVVYADIPHAGRAFILLNPAERNKQN